MAETTQFVRQWLLLRSLCSRGTGRSLHELSLEFRVSSKTIARDLDVLRRVGFPVQETVGFRGQKYWHCNNSGFLVGLVLTFDELAALYLGRQLLEPFAGTLFWESATRAFRKIKAGLNQQALEYLENFRSAIHRTSPGTGDYADRSECIDQLMIAIEDRNVTKLLYCSLSSDTPQEVLVHPHGLVFHRAALYLVAFVPERMEFRHYKIDRIHDLDRLVDDRFQRQEGFNLQEHLAGSFGVFQGTGKEFSIRIRFFRDAARYVEEHRWHPSQRLTPGEDGSVLMEINLTQLEEVKSWVMSFGAKALVEAPDELREMVAADLRQLSASYAERERSRP